MGRYHHLVDVEYDSLGKIKRNPIIDPTNANSRINPRVNPREILNWKNLSVELQQFENGIQYFLDIPKHESPIRLNIVGHGNRHKNTYSSCIKCKPRYPRLMPQQLFDSIVKLLNKYNINSIRLCCCHLGRTGFAQELANLTNKPVKALMGQSTITFPFISQKYLNNRYIIHKDPTAKIRVDNNRQHDIDVSDSRFVWFYPQNM
ncbi:hypothetical protein Xbed_00489 [Xenorhabdus beddingii]|uniref:Uncharacterized protein n=1 Tax=Xenorhabdus beddingii TaxID=40578 RepID=A0A1Y2SR14_9GAMM|nr:hypothetical protein [Xenorhabdus beddingii]OTA21262.1 hypothetical protein Xbed_00489 [Xenorhabdus beddingii]